MKLLRDYLLDWRVKIIIADHWANEFKALRKRKISPEDLMRHAGVKNAWCAALFCEKRRNVHL